MSVWSRSCLLPIFKPNAFHKLGYSNSDTSVSGLNGESEAVPVGIHDHRSVIVSSADPPGPKDSEAELDISVSSLSPVTGSQPGSPVSLLSSDSQWSLSEVVVMY